MLVLNRAWANPELESVEDNSKPRRAEAEFSCLSSIVASSYGLNRCKRVATIHE